MKNTHPQATSISKVTAPSTRPDLVAAAIDRVVERVWVDPLLRQRCAGVVDLRKSVTATIAARLTGESGSTAVLTLTETEATVLRDHLVIAMRSLRISDATVAHAQVVFDCSPTMTELGDRACELSAATEFAPEHSRSTSELDGSAAPLPSEPSLSTLIASLDSCSCAAEIQACLTEFVARAAGGTHAAYWESTNNWLTCRSVVSSAGSATALGVSDDGASFFAADGDVVVRRESSGSGAIVIVPIVADHHVLGWCEARTPCDVSEQQIVALRAAGQIAGAYLYGNADVAIA